MKICIKNGRVINPASQLDVEKNLYIDDGKIVAIRDSWDNFTADQYIDASNLLVIPGLVDLSVRLREPSQEHTATIASETAAAVAGGITTLVVPPDTNPVIDNPTVVELIEDRAQAANRAQVFTLGAMTQGLNHELLAEMARLKEAGCVGISNGLFSIKNTLILQRALAYAASLDMTVFIEASDPWLQQQGCIHDGPMSARLGLTGIPESAETIAVSRYLILIEQTGVSAHFHNLSSGKAVSMIRAAQERGLPVTADVSAHHLHLSDHDIGNFDPLTHVLPPLRSMRDKEQLQQAVSDGVITAISSHHQPLNSDDKLGPFSETKPGISGLETLLPLTMKLVEDELLDLHCALAALTCNPANIINLDAGQIKEGAEANICFVNPQAKYECQPINFVSAGKNNPFGGWLFDYQVQKTLFQGRLVFDSL